MTALAAQITPRLDTNRPENRIVSLGTGAGRRTRPLGGREAPPSALAVNFRLPIAMVRARNRMI
jgi:hypothetical protein